MIEIIGAKIANEKESEKIEDKGSASIGEILKRFANSTENCYLTFTGADGAVVSIHRIDGALKLNP